MTKSGFSLSGFAFDLSSSADTREVKETDQPYVGISNKSATATTYEMSVSMQMSVDTGSSSSRIFLLNFGGPESVQP